MGVVGAEFLSFLGGMKKARQNTVIQTRVMRVSKFDEIHVNFLRLSLGGVLRNRAGDFKICRGAAI